jgi:chaperonin GroEL
VSKQYESGLKLHNKILEGVKKLAKNVASTLGPRGRNVILCRKGQRPIITKDGVSVAKFIEFDDPFENVGAQIIKQAAAKTNLEAGDGTTTSTVLAKAIFEKAQKYLIAETPPIELKRGIDKAVERIVENLQEMSKPISSEEDIAHIATISSNGDKTIGKLIATAVDLAGKDGAITIEEARSVETSLDIVEGFRFDSGYLATAFITDEKRGVVRYEDPLILVTDEKIETVDEMMPVLELISREARPAIIVADNIEGQALAALIMNAMRGTLRVAAVKAPRYGEERRNILKDLALSVGATFVTRSENLRLKDVKLTDFGTSKTFECSKNETTISGGRGKLEDVEKRIEALKVELEQTEDIYQCEKIQGRITRLASGIAIIRVGAATEVEMIEKKHRIEDALEAVKAALQEGIVPGGGIALIRASKDLNVEAENEDQELGVKIVLEAVKEPLKQMAVNAGDAPDLIFSTVERQEGSFGIDFVSGNEIDMLEEGVIDPVKVTRCALQNAASAASILITTNHAVIEV